MAKGKGKVQSDNDEFQCGLPISGFRRLVHVQKVRQSGVRGRGETP